LKVGAAVRVFVSEPRQGIGEYFRVIPIQILFRNLDVRVAPRDLGKIFLRGFAYLFHLHPVTAVDLGPVPPCREAFVFDQSLLDSVCQQGTQRWSLFLDLSGSDLLFQPFA
jgi:hypothetical protein